MNLLKLSQNIRRVRLAQGMTVAGLAEKSGFSKGFISQVENFRQSPSLKALLKISDALGVSLSALFDEDENYGKEYLFVILEGSLDFRLFDDQNRHIMKEGDTLYLRANIPHRVLLAPGCAHAKALAVYTDPDPALE